MTFPELDYSDSSGDDFEALSRDKVPVRSMTEKDLPAIVGIDRKITGRDRTAYYKRKLAEVMRESGVRVSLVAEIDGMFAGFIMARVDFGEFGRTATTAVIDTIGINPGFARKSVGKALLSQLLHNLASLRVEKVMTEVDWNKSDLSSFLRTCGFAPSQRLTFVRRL